VYSKTSLPVVAVYVFASKSYHVVPESGDAWIVTVTAPVFTDTLTKGNFGIFDQSIFKLNVLDKYSNPITNFKNWIDTLNVSQYPNDKFIFLFTTTSEYVNSESIDIINRSTKELVRMISIAYSDFNYATNRYTNVVSVADLIIR
jgi:hypothetical protein